MRVIMLASALLLPAIGVAFADDRPLTEQERARLTEAVKTDGCTAEAMKVDDREFEVEATCADNKKYEFKFDAQFKLIKKEVDD